MNERTQKIDIGYWRQTLVDEERFDASSMGDYKATAMLTSNDELIVSIAKRLPEEDIYDVTRILFDHETTQKIRKVLSFTQ